MTGDCQVRFCERLGVRFPRPTRRIKIRPAPRAGSGIRRVVWRMKPEEADATLFFCGTPGKDEGLGEEKPV